MGECLTGVQQPVASDPAKPILELVDNPGDELRRAILEPLAQFNSALRGPPGAGPLCIAIRGEDGSHAGGLWGGTFYDCLAIELLVVPEALRGQGLGRAMLERAEQEARARGCIGAWLDTFSFQARGFYEKLGYGLAGTIADHPIGGARYFLMKRWDR